MLSELLNALQAQSGRSRKDREEAEMQEMVTAPKFDEPNPSDWRLLVGDNTRKLWFTFTEEQRRGIIRDTQAMIMKINVMGMLREALSVEAHVIPGGPPGSVGVAIGPRGSPLPEGISIPGFANQGSGEDDGIRIRPEVKPMDGYNFGRKGNGGSTDL